MTSLSIFQIGDIHYPEWEGSRHASDDKDPKLSSAIKGGLSSSPLRNVLSALADRGSSPATQALVFMGDFTSHGRTELLRPALQHFSWLCKESRHSEAAPKLLLVPGNHDVAKRDAQQLGQAGKFEAFNNWAREALWITPPVETPTHVPLESPSGKVHVFLLNTTLGSWEQYLVHGAMRETISREDFSASSQPDHEKIQIKLAGSEVIEEPTSDYDQLDTPYVSASSIQFLKTAIDKISRRDAVVLVGHHNILPQEQPRLSAYSEMLNAGYLRRFLLSLHRPVVYLHGHTHVDLIEEVRQPREPASKLIAIAAPKLSEGFNELIFHFDTKKNVVGFRLLPWRFSSSHEFGPSPKTQTVCSLHDASRFHPSKESSDVFEALRTSGDTRFHMDDMRGITGRSTEELEWMLLELFFWRFLDLDQTGRPPNEWRAYILQHSDRK